MLEVKNLTFSIGSAKKRTNILNQLNLKINDGEFVVITGPNGSGKSTFAKLIMGLEKATDGTITFNQQDITDKTITERARLSIAFAFQQPPHFKGVTVKDILQISATGQETFIEDNETDYKKLIQSVGLDESYLNREVNNTLSGGELKRIEIASAFARNAKLTIFDEPEAGIDIWSFDKLIQLFKKMRQNAPERTLIIISHQKRLITQSDRVIVLRDGHIASEGHPNDILPELQEQIA